MTETPHTWYARHAETLDRALTAIRERSYWSAYPESPSPRVYGETAAADGEAAFQRATSARTSRSTSRARRDGSPPRPARSASRWTSATRTPTSTRCSPPPTRRACPAWRDAGPQTRAGVCAGDPRTGCTQHIFELANAVQLTTGQAFVMAFQAGGAHALDRALEARRLRVRRDDPPPGERRVGEAGGQGRPAADDARPSTSCRAGSRWSIGCNTFPTWNSYPGLFASPGHRQPGHRQAAPARRAAAGASPSGIAREVLAEAGFDPNLVHARRRGAGREAGRDAGDPARGADRRLHRLDRVRRLAGGQRPAGVGLHREGRRQHDRGRLDRRLRRHVPQHRVLAVALQRTDVHDAAEHPGARRRHRDRRGPQELRRGGRRRSPAPSAS